jgi:hypothetical protein
LFHKSLIVINVLQVLHVYKSVAGSGIAYPNAGGIIQPFSLPNFVIIQTGIYAIYYQVRGAPVNVDGTVVNFPLAFELQQDGAPITGSQYESEARVSLVEGETEVVTGFVLVQITASIATPVNLTLHNITNFSANAVQLTADGTVNASLLIEQIG